jgi:amidophosphoribosyltransferase
VQDGNEDLKRFDTSCFSGEYVTGVDSAFLEQQEALRSDSAKNERRTA